MVKDLLAVQATHKIQVSELDWEDPLAEEMFKKQ